MNTFEHAYNQLLLQIKSHAVPNLILLGIRSRGDILAQRIAKDLITSGTPVEVGSLDISLYRDDFNLQKVFPKLQSTIIPPTIDNSNVIIIDDVIQTGRTIRAALDAINDFGRPKTIKMAALVDLGGRELPISCDFTGTKIDITPDQKVRIQLKETQEEDRLLILENNHHA